MGIPCGADEAQPDAAGSDAGHDFNWMRDLHLHAGSSRPASSSMGLDNTLSVIQQSYIIASTAPRSNCSQHQGAAKKKTEA